MTVGASGLCPIDNAEFRCYYALGVSEIYLLAWTVFLVPTVAFQDGYDECSVDVSLDIGLVDMDVDINTEPLSYLLGIQKTVPVSTCMLPPYR